MSMVQSKTSSFEANTNHLPNVGLVLVRRRDDDPTLSQHRVNAFSLLGRLHDSVTEYIHRFHLWFLGLYLDNLF